MTVLTVNLSTPLQTQLSQTGIWAYAVYFSGGVANWTTISDNGVLTGGTGAASITLPYPDNGGKVYFLIQSADTAHYTDLTTAISQESDINWNNAAAKDFRYDSFEVSLLGQPGDAANLTSVNGFGIPMQASVTYNDGSTTTRGYGVSGGTIFSDIAAINTSAGYVYTYDYTSGPLANHVRAAISPTLAVTPNTTTSGTSFSESDWSSYLTKLVTDKVIPTVKTVGDIGAEAATHTRPDIVVTGFFDGTADASNVWHNAAFFSYVVEWDGSNFWLAPTAQSQVKGYIKIAQSDLEESIYSTLGTAEIYAKPTDATPYMTMNTGENNQWGAVFTQFLTGFTGGYYGVEGKQNNSSVAGTIDLDKTWNWDPTYAFGNNLSGSAPTYFDHYSEVFYKHSNSYGSGYSDNLMQHYSTGGPLIPVYDSGTGQNVTNIGLTLYADSETPAGYVDPTIYNYIAPAAGGYEATSQNTLNTNITLNFATQYMVLKADTPITISFMGTNPSGQQAWYSVTIKGNLWQNWTLTYNAATDSYSAAAAPGPEKTYGSMVISNLPTAESGVSWYKITVGDDVSKTYNLYTTTTGSLFQNPAYSGQEAALAIDGLATITPSESTDATINTFTVNFLYSTTTSLDPQLLTANTNATFLSTLATPDAPVVGKGAGANFTALSGQDSATANTVNAATGALFFAWTGKNNSTVDTQSWISAYTNKIGALDVAKVSFAKSGGGTHYQPVSAVGNLDGEWQTAKAAALGNGTYTVTMTEYAPDGSTVVGKTSSALTLNVSLDKLGLHAGSDGSSLVLDQGSSSTDGNWIHFSSAGITGLHGATLLLYAVDSSGNLVGRDGQIGGGVTIQDATIASIGGVVSDSGDALLDTAQSAYLPVGQQLRFAILSGGHVIDSSASVNIADATNGMLNVNVGGVQVTAQVENTLGSGAELASTQRSLDEALVYLNHGESLSLEVTGSSAMTNKLGFVHMDIDAATGQWSVDGVDYGNTTQFTDAVRNHLVGEVNVSGGGSHFTDTLQWTVQGDTGYYAPVLLTESGEVFVIGNANSDGQEHIRLFGENTFGFEDLTASQNSDFDYNDMVVKIVPSHDLLV